MCVTKRLQKKYEFYANYHRNPINKFIHFICIPSICFSLFILLNYIPLEIDITKIINDNTTNYLEDITIPKCSLVLRLSSLLYIFYFIYYCYLTPCLGLIANIFYFAVLFGANYFYCKIEYAYAYAIGIQILGWVLQILGHRFWEGNSPAFIKGFKDSFLLAPLFVTV